MAIATTTFEGFRPEAIDFLAELAANNDRDWFNPRKTEYERLLKTPMEALVAALAEALAARDIPLLADPSARSSGSIATRGSPRTSRRTRPTSGPASRGSRPARRSAGDRGRLGPRQRRLLQLPAGRDVRRRRDVDAREGAARCLPTGGRRRAGPGRGRARGARVRRRVRGGERARASQARPAGLPADHPQADLLRFKDVVFGRRLGDDEVLSPSLPDTLAEAYAAGMPVFRFLATIHG